MIAPEELEEKLMAAFPDAKLEIADLTGTRDHYQATIVTTLFEGKSPIEQHQMVYRALATEMKGPIHALSLKTFTPSTYAKKMGK